MELGKLTRRTRHIHQGTFSWHHSSVEMSEGAHLGDELLLLHCGDFGQIEPDIHHGRWVKESPDVLDQLDNVIFLVDTGPLAILLIQPLSVGLADSILIDVDQGEHTEENTKI